MKRSRIMRAALIAVLALAAVMASGAQAITAPFWSINGTRLVAGRTHNYASREYAASFELEVSVGGTEVLCKGWSDERGVLLGSSPGEPGAASETITFSGCELTRGNGLLCHLSNEPEGIARTTTLTTSPLRSELVENVVGGAGGTKLFEELHPEKDGTFMTIFFGGTCTSYEAVVTGTAVAEWLTDNGREQPIELGAAAKEATSWLVRFPPVAIKEVWLITSAGGKVATTGLEWGEFESNMRGTFLVLLASSKFDTEPSTGWSALP